MSADNSKTTRAANPIPLIAFSDRWKLDGDYIRCRECNRPQIASAMLHDFRHAAGCRNVHRGSQQPWVELRSLDARPGKLTGATASPI